MKVVLIKNVPKLGIAGEIKEVKDGYAMNFLFSNKLAVRGVGANLKAAEAKLEKTKSDMKLAQAQASQLTSKVNKGNFVHISDKIKGSRLKSSLSNDEIIALALAKINMKDFDRVSVELSGKYQIRELGKNNVGFKIVSKDGFDFGASAQGEFVVDVRRE